MRRVLPVAVAAAALCFSQLTAATAAAPVGDAVTAPTRAAAAPAQVRTSFALAAAALGTRVAGGAVPVSSDETAFQLIGCTNKAGLLRTNTVADQKIPGLGRLEGVATRLWTEKVGNTVSVYSSHKIAKLVLAESALGSVEVQGISSLSRAFNANGKFGVSTENKVARIVLKLAGSPDQALDIPAPGQTLTIPGILSIGIGKTEKAVTSTFAQQNASVLDVKFFPTNTRALVAPTLAKIGGKIKQGIFRGYSAGVEARGLADNLQVGRQPLTLMPCQGTFSKTDGRAAAGVALGDLGNVRGVASAQRTVNKATVATATNAGRVAGVSLLGGRIQVNGIVGVANVKRERGKVTSNANGSTVVQVIIDGRTYSFPKFGKIEIPGLVKLEEAITKKSSEGIKVIGLRITLLDGTAAVVDLGVAELGIRQGAKPPKAKRR